MVELDKRVTNFICAASNASKLSALLIPPSNTKVASRMPKRRRIVASKP